MAAEMNTVIASSDLPLAVDDCDFTSVVAAKSGASTKVSTVRRCLVLICGDSLLVTEEPAKLFDAEGHPQVDAEGKVETELRSGVPSGFDLDETTVRKIVAAMFPGIVVKFNFETVIPYKEFAYITIQVSGAKTGLPKIMSVPGAPKSNWHTRSEIEEAITTAKKEGLLTPVVHKSLAMLMHLSVRKEAHPLLKSWAKSSPPSLTAEKPAEKSVRPPRRRRVVDTGACADRR